MDVDQPVHSPSVEALSKATISTKEDPSTTIVNGNGSSSSGKRAGEGESEEKKPVSPASVLLEYVDAVEVEVGEGEREGERAREGRSPSRETDLHAFPSSWQTKKSKKNAPPPIKKRKTAIESDDSDDDEEKDKPVSAVAEGEPHQVSSTRRPSAPSFRSLG